MKTNTKKVISLVLTFMMILSAMTFTASAESVLVPTEMYAGVSTITLKYDVPVSEESEIGIITLLEENGTEIVYMPYYNGNILTLKTENALEIDGQTYKLVINDKTYSFNLETVWQLNVDETGNVTNVKANVPSDKKPVLASVRKDTVIEENTAILSGEHTSFSPDYDQTKHENLSMVFEYAHINSWHVHFGIRFNASKQNGAYRRYPNGIKYSSAFWETASQGTARTNTRAIAIYDAKNTDNKTLKGLNPASADAVVPAKYDLGITYSNFRNLQSGSYSEVYKYVTDTATEKGVLTKGSATLNTPNGLSSDLKTYSYVVDKMGATGTVVLDNQLLDVWNTEIDYAEYNAEKDPDLTAPKTGYMELDSDLSAMIIKNWKLVKSNIREHKTGDITVAETVLNGDNEKFEIIFNEEIELVENVKDYIKLSLGGNNIDYAYIAEGNKITITPDGGLVPDEQYDVKVLTGFGYEALTVKNDIDASYMYVSAVGDLSVTDVFAGYKEMHLTFNGEIDRVTEADFKEKVKIYDNGEEITYNLSIEGKKAVLSLNTSLERDKIYDLNVLEGLGYEKVTVKQDKKNYFILGDVWKADLSGTGLPAYMKVSSYNSAGKAKVAVSDNTIYLQDAAYAYLEVIDAVNNLEKYALTFKMKHYGSNASILFFNTDGAKSAHIQYSKVTGYGWRTNGESYQLKDYLYYNAEDKSNNKDSISKSGTASENPVAITGTTAFASFFSDEKGIIRITLPEENAPEYTYKVDKKGTVADLYINNSYVSTLDAKSQIETAASKGNIIFAASGADAKPTVERPVVAISEIVVSGYKEYTDGGVKIVEDERNISGTSATGSLKIRNYFADESKTAAVLVAAYGENGKFLGVRKVIDVYLTPGQIETATYSFTASEEIKEIKVELIDEEIMPYDAEIEVKSALQTDFENNVITVKGKVAPYKKDRTVYMLLAKDEGFVTPWSGTTETDGNLTVINIPAEAESFEYTLSYKELLDVEPYKMSIYAVTWKNGVKLKKLGVYNYARNEDVLAFAETVKTTKTTYEEIEKYAQSLGIELSFADTSYKQGVLIETIYDERGTITNKNDLSGVMLMAKARADMLSEIHKNASTAAFVNKAITDHASMAGLNLTQYNALNSAQKIIVCTGFVNADYESLGYAEFVKAFNSAVLSVTAVTPPAGGGGGGGGFTTPPTPAKPKVEVTVGPDEYTGKDAVEIIGGKQGFADMEGYEWAETAVNALADEGVISGIGNKMFNPEGIVTREQIAKMIVSVLNVLDNSLTSDYSDVDKSGWAVNFIASAKKAGIMKGVSETEFAPHSAVTREDLAVILYRATLKKDKKYETRKTDFTDKDLISHYAKEAVEFMAGEGIINGFEDGSFKPKAPATRAQAAVLIYNALVGGGK